MLSNGFAGPLRLQRKPSKLLASYLIVLHLLGLIALLLPIAMSGAWQGVLLGLLTLSAVYHVHYYRQQRDDTSSYWVWLDSGNWRYGDENRTYQLVVSKSVQTPWFVALTLTDTQQQRRLLFVRDQLAADTFRHLRVRFKLHHEVTASGRDEPA